MKGQIYPKFCSNFPSSNYCTKSNGATVVYFSPVRANASKIGSFWPLLEISFFCIETETSFASQLCTFTDPCRGVPAAVLLLLQVCLTASLALTWIHSWQKCGFDTTRATLLISTFVALMFCQSPSLPPSPIYVPTPRLRERELQLQSDLTTASREINRLRVNIKQAGSNSSSRGAGEEGNSRRPTPLSSASIAALSLRSPPEERDRQH